MQKNCGIVLLLIETIFIQLMGVLGGLRRKGDKPPIIPHPVICPVPKEQRSLSTTIILGGTYLRLPTKHAGKPCIARTIGYGRVANHVVEDKEFAPYGKVRTGFHRRHVALTYHQFGV
jgi:hypothetical protein